ncbi:MAG: insulinase family protein [Bacteroidia bacterium]|nr:insulinase family protein [Bacteroidia bacterium]
MKKYIIAAFILALSQGAWCQTKLIEKIDRKAGELTIPYSKYVLSNGLTVVIHEDHSDPIVHIDVTYHVGSAREIIGKSGFAHFFEHMMFQGSKHVGDDQHFKMVSEAGGTLNGTTNRDRTNYFETLPKNQLEVGLWLEADRMGFLLDSVTQQKFEIQRSTVKNERGQNYDNRPYGLVGETTSRVLYPKGHPYSWLTIGYISHLDAVDVNDLKAFFMEYYGAANATLTVGGDVNTADVLKLAEKYFGSIPAGPKVEKLKMPKVTLNDTRYISGADNIRFPLIQRTYPTVPFYSKDEPALDILASILADSKSSVFYKNFIKTQLGNSAQSYHYAAEQAGEFVISVRAFPNQKLSTIDSLIDVSFAEFERNGISDDDLLKAKASAEKGFISSIESVSGKVSKLAAYQTFTGNANYIQQEYSNYQNLTREDIMRVYQTYVKGKNYVALSWYPKGKENRARPDNFLIPELDAAAPHKDVTVKYSDPKDNFDRSMKPKAGDAPFVTVPDYISQRAGNGMRIIASYTDDVPLINAQIVLAGGHLLDAYDTTKLGLANITARMMNEATKKYTAEQLETALDKLGSSITINCGAEATYVYISSLKKNWAATLDLLSERLLNPAFNADDFERIKKQILEGIANAHTVATSIAEKNYNKILYGNQSIKGSPVDGWQHTVSNITLDDVKSFYNKYYGPDLAQLIVVGDVDVLTLQQQFSFLQTWPKKNYNVPDVTYLSAHKKGTIYFIDKEDAAQSEIRVGYLVMPFDATGEFYRCNVMNFSLGGAFNSRINYTLREEKGWTYGSRSRFNGSKTTGPYTVSGGFRKDATDSAIVEIVNQIKAYKNDIKQSELDFTKSSLSQSEALKYETLNQKANFIGLILDYGLSRDYTTQQYKILNSMQLADMKRLANTYLPIDQMYMLVVGDKKYCFEKLQKLGYPVIELDKEGNIKM